MGSKRKGLQRESSILQSLNLQRQCLWTAPCQFLQLDYSISLSVLGILPAGSAKPAVIFPGLPSTPLPVYTVVRPSLRGRGSQDVAMSKHARMVPGKLEMARVRQLSCIRPVATVGYFSRVASQPDKGHLCSHIFVPYAHVSRR